MSRAWVEIDKGTGERRLHTEASLAARLKMLGINPDTAASSDVSRSWFRPARGDEETLLPHANPSGCWGAFQGSAPCPVCKGSGKVEHHDELTRDVTTCWKCQGRGIV